MVALVKKASACMVTAALVAAAMMMVLPATAGAAAAAAAAEQIIKDPPKGAKNVLMIIVDDLRPEAAYFNESFSEHTHFASARYVTAKLADDAAARVAVHTPNIDRLGKGGLVMNRAFCQQAICGPTRNSFMVPMQPTQPMDLFIVC
jgi:hypothetical protein